MTNFDGDDTGRGNRILTAVLSLLVAASIAGIIACAAFALGHAFQ